MLLHKIWCCLFVCLSFQRILWKEKFKFQNIVTDKRMHFFLNFCYLLKNFDILKCFCIFLQLFMLLNERKLIVQVVLTEWTEMQFFNDCWKQSLKSLYSLPMNEWMYISLKRITLLWMRKDKNKYRLIVVNLLSWLGPL